MPADQKFVYATVTIEIKLYDEGEPLTAAEIEELASDGPGSWESWNVLEVGPRRDRSIAC